MAAKPKSKRSKKTITVRLVAEQPVEGGNGFFYTAVRNQKMEGGDNGKIRLMKYHPKAKKHIWFKEEKISKSKK